MRRQAGTPARDRPVLLAACSALFLCRRLVVSNFYLPIGRWDLFQRLNSEVPSKLGLVISALTSCFGTRIGNCHLCTVRGMKSSDIPSLPKTPCLSKPHNDKTAFQKALWHVLWSCYFLRRLGPVLIRLQRNPRSTCLQETPSFNVRSVVKICVDPISLNLCEESSGQSGQHWLRRRPVNSVLLTNRASKKPVGSEFAVETFRLKKQSAAVTLMGRPSALVCGLPAFPATGEASLIWRACPFSGCGFQVPNAEASKCTS